MAELDPEKVGRSGVDPVTGSPLSQEVRTALLKKSTIDASVFQNIENRRAQTDAQNAELSKGQNSIIHGRKLTQVKRDGSISYAKAIKDLLPDADLTKYKGQPTTFWKLG